MRNIKLAAPLAMLSVTTVYLTVNIAYFSVVSKADVLSSRRIVASVVLFITTKSICSHIVQCSVLSEPIWANDRKGRHVSTEVFYLD